MSEGNNWGHTQKANFLELGREAQKTAGKQKRRHIRVVDSGFLTAGDARDCFNVWLLFSPGAPTRHGAHMSLGTSHTLVISFKNSPLCNETKTHKHWCKKVHRG